MSMNRFIGRREELATLDRIYREENHKTCMVYGRRRIGKTRLLREFTKDKRSIYIDFVKGTELRNVNRIADILYKEYGITDEISDLYHAMKAIEGLCSEQKTVVVFDELPYLIKKNEAAASELQHFVDWVLMNTDSMVIACGSSIRMMLDCVKGDSPLYGRFAFKIDMYPMRLEEAREFHPSSSGRDLLRTYLTIGGIPTYHALFGDRDYRSIIDSYVLENSARAGDDMMLDLQVELGSMTDNALAVLEAMSSGKSGFTEIRDATGLNDNTLTKCLSRLCMMRMVSELDRLPEKDRTTRYVISDMFVSFYFRIIDRYRPISMMERGSVYESMNQLISTQLGRAFEIYCRDLIVRSYPCTEIGCWWGKVPERDDEGEIMMDILGKPVTEAVDIDVVACLRRGNQRIYLMGECKFAGSPMGMSVFRELECRTAEVAKNLNIRYALFSASGFTEELTEFAKGYGIHLFGLPELLGESDLPEIV